MPATSRPTGRCGRSFAPTSCSTFGSRSRLWPTSLFEPTGREECTELAPVLRKAIAGRQEQRGGMGERQEAVVNIACIQMEPVVGDKDRNVARSLELIEEAAGRRARPIVLPELCQSGYVFERRGR